MKKLLLASAAFGLLSFAAPAFADSHGGKGKKFEQMDTNGDGSVSESEFLANAKAKFQKLDSDGDGLLTKAEGKKHREAIKERLQNRQNSRGE